MQFARHPGSLIGDGPLRLLLRRRSTRRLRHYLPAAPDEHPGQPRRQYRRREEGSRPLIARVAAHDVVVRLAVNEAAHSGDRQPSQRAAKGAVRGDGIAAHAEHENQLQAFG